MDYNKKQMQPLIDKYGINPETNKLFAQICEMFEGQSNYQLWAVKMVFSQSITFDELKAVNEWIKTNAEQIVKLEKQNIVSYANKTKFSQLRKEIDGLTKLSFIKDIISHFNTAQKKMLSDAILGGTEMTPLAANQSAHINEWYGILKAFDKKPFGIKSKFYSNCSSFTDTTKLLQAIKSCLEASYSWKDGKEDLFAFMEHNAKDCDIVFNEGDCVIIHVPSYCSSKKLCGNGRTQWCITKEEHYFNSYVSNHSNRRQYFLFDFSRREIHPFAHIGFTIENGRGVVEAQTCNNSSMLSHPYSTEGESYSINDIFKKFNIDMSIFMKLPKDLGFNWRLSDFVEMVSNNKKAYTIAYADEGHLIIKVTSNNALDKLLSKTFINASDYYGSSTSAIYLALDFNKPIENDSSFIVLEFTKDQYGLLSCNKATNIYGVNVTTKGITKTIGVDTEKFLNLEPIDPSILLHKYINDGEEKKAIELIEKEGGNINVNYEFNQRIPIFSAIDTHMFDLFTAIINHKNFNPTISDGFDETLSETIIYLVGSDEIITSDEDDKILTKMINVLLNSKNYDFNAKDLNHDVPINVACEFPKVFWVVENLLSRKEIDINVTNDYGGTALGNCIRNNNLKALKLLGQRPDLKVTKEDMELANEYGIKLNEYIAPNPNFFDEIAPSTEAALEYELTRA